MKNEFKYYLKGVVCHNGQSLIEGHYKCYILEWVDSSMCYHLLDDDTHTLVSESDFQFDVNRNGYLFLYGKTKVAPFEGKLYYGHRTEFLSLEKQYLHFLRKRGRPRIAKAARQSDIGLQPKTNLSQILTGESEELFSLNSKENEDNSIEEINESSTQNVDFLHAKKVNRIRRVDMAIGETPNVIDKDGVPIESVTIAPTNLNEPKISNSEVNESVEKPYLHGSSNVDAIIIYEEGQQAPYEVNSDGRARVIQNFKLSFKEQTLNSLQPGKWLNDCAINYFLCCLSISAPKENIIVLDSQLIGTIQADLSKMERSLEGKLGDRNLTTLTSLDILVPLNVDGTHWVLASLQTFRGYVTLYDSLKNTSMEKEHVDFMNEIMDGMDSIMKRSNNALWKVTMELDVEILFDLPSQNNGYDCGLYTCMYAKLVYFDEDMVFGPKFISSLRTFLHDHIRDSQHYFLTFQEHIWDNQTNSEGLVDYGK